MDEGGVLIVEIEVVVDLVEVEGVHGDAVEGEEEHHQHRRGVAEIRALGGAVSERDEGEEEGDDENAVVCEVEQEHQRHNERRPLNALKRRSKERHREGEVRAVNLHQLLCSHLCICVVVCCILSRVPSVAAIGGGGDGGGREERLGFRLRNVFVR